MLRFEAQGLRLNSALLGCWLLLLFFLPFTSVRTVARGVRQLRCL
jgi:hypothetical protein